MRQLVLAALLAVPAAAQEADRAALSAIRDAAVPGQCDLAWDAETHRRDGLALHVLPCRAIGSDVLSVVISEGADGTLTPLSLRSPLVEPGPGADGAQDWTLPVAREVAQSYLAPSVDASFPPYLTTTGPMPRAGEGARIEMRHVVEDGAARLRRATVIGEGLHAEVWIPSEPRGAAGLPFGHMLDGFGIEAAPEASGTRPIDVILGALSLGGPLHPEEEGRDVLGIHMEQSGRRIVAEVESSGWADDSVRGAVWRVLMLETDGLWSVTGLGRLNLCRRGAPVSKERCP